MSILAWLVVGLIAGFLASKVINKTGSGLVMDIVLGVIGGYRNHTIPLKQTSVMVGANNQTFSAAC